MSLQPTYILAVDLGTSGPKVALIAENGTIAARATRSIETLRIPPDGAEQDADALWAAVCDATRQVLREAAQPKEVVVGVVCVSQFSSVVPVDTAGAPLMNLVLWMDQRGAPHGQAIYAQHPTALPTWLDVHGVIPLPTGADSLSHMLYIQHARPEIYARTYKFLEAMDYLNFRLTGEAVGNLCSTFMMLLTNNRALDSLAYDPTLLAMSGIDPDKLPALRPLESWIGRVRPEIAEDLGLPANVRVFSSCNDTHAAAIATGAFQDHHGGINVGTTSQVLAQIDHKATELEAGIVSMPSALAGRYTVMAENGFGGETLKHFLERVIFARDALSDVVPTDPFAALDTAVAQVPAGSGGLLYLPWLSGSQSPVYAPLMRGGFVNMNHETDRIQMLRAIMEGVMFNLRWIIAPVEEFVGYTLDHLCFSGGGAVSNQWSQMAANILDRPVIQLDDARFSNNRAAAFLAFRALERLGPEDLRTICPIHQTYEPQPAHRARYAAMFGQFSAAFEHLRPICEALNA